MVCLECDKKIKKGDEIYSYINFSYFCSSCWIHKDIKDKSFKPHKYKYYGGDFPYYFGIELEISSKNKKEIYDLVEKYKNFEFFYFIKDESVPHYSVEIVTNPASFDFHYEFWKDFYKDLEKINLVNDSAGLHFHITNVGNIKDNLFYYIEKRYDNLFKVSGRNEEEKKFVKKHLNVSCDSIEIIQEENNKKKNKQYMINCSNTNTIEIRTFKSPKTFKKFYSILLFIKNISHYAYSLDFNNFSENFDYIVNNSEIFLKDLKK